MRDTELAFMPTSELRACIASKQLSPVEVTRLYLQRIETLDTQLNSYLTVTGDLALQMARDAEQAVLDGKPHRRRTSLRV
jgi:aspartyl-tRNA(Asn)/glutamyl-tRNA(Gln) amidotransferase subunit A